MVTKSFHNKIITSTSGKKPSFHPVRLKTVENLVTAAIDRLAKKENFSIKI